MMRALALSTLWILGAAAAFAALWWGFLNTPESTVFMLGLSLMLVIGMVVVVGLAWGGALAAWDGASAPATIRVAAAGLRYVLPPALVVGIAWWLVGVALSWMDAHSGEIGAWFIATLGWTDVTWLLTAATYLGQWLRGVVAPFAALVWFARLRHSGWPAFERSALALAFAPGRIAAATVIAVLALWAPLRYGLYWRPLGLPASWVEPAVALAKFALLATLAAVGLSLIAKLASARGPD